MKTEIADVSGTARAPKNKHGDLPTLSDARNADGSFDQEKLRAGIEAWTAALFGPDATHKIVNGSELRADWNNDVLVIVRQKLSKDEKAAA